MEVKTKKLPETVADAKVLALSLNE